MKPEQLAAIDEIRAKENKRRLKDGQPRLKVTEVVQDILDLGISAYKGTRK